MLAVVLLVQAAARAAVWLGIGSAVASQVVDLLVLALLGIVVALAPVGAGWAVRLGGGWLAVSVMWLLQQGDVTTVLLILAIAHNFTPLGLSWDMARNDPTARPLAWYVTGLCALPLLVIATGGGWHAPWIPAALLPQASLLDGQLPAAWGGAHRQAWLSAIVLAQCLHYYCVIVLLPRAVVRRTAQPVLPAVARIAAVAVSIWMLYYFAYDGGGARKLYAVAAGIHAWLEWPVLLMAFMSLGRHVALEPSQTRLAG